MVAELVVRRRRRCMGGWVVWRIIRVAGEGCVDGEQEKEAAWESVRRGGRGRECGGEGADGGGGMGGWE